MKPASQIREEHARLHPFLKEEAVTPVITMVVPGRRALGETWSKVTIGTDGSNLTYEREDAAAPADGKSIMAVSGKDWEMTRYILDAQFVKAKERRAAVTELSKKERFEALNEAWLNFNAMLVRIGKGQTTIGPKG